MDEKKTESRKHHFRGSLFGPLLLISIGIVFLLQNTGALRGDVWRIILNLWPILLIVWGLDEILKRESLVWAAMLIGLGAVFLLSNFGYLTVNVWEMLSRLWPLLLIAIGLDIAIGKRSAWGGVIGLAIMLLLLGGALYLFGIRLEAGQPLTGEQITQGFGGASRAQLVIEPAAGALRLDGDPEPDGLIQGRVQSFGRERVNQNFSVSGDTAIFTLRGSGGVTFSISDEGGGEWSWDLSLTPTIPLDIKTGMGAGKTEINLTGLTISNLDVNYGVGETILILPETGGFAGEISGAIGIIHIVLPRGVGLRLDEDAAIVSVNVPEGFAQDGGLYTSPGFAQAAEQIELKVNLAIGSIEVVYADK